MRIQQGHRLPLDATPARDERGAEGDTSTADAPAETDAVDVIDSNFEPRYVKVSVGTVVTWTQTGVAPHTVTHDDARPKLQPARGEFDSHPDCPGTCMGQGDEFTLTFTEPGEYPYYCVVHGRPARSTASRR